MLNIKHFINKVKKLNESIKYDDVEQWMSGDCIPFVVALCEVFPHYHIGVLNNEYESDDEYNFDFVHAFCYPPNNYNIIIDALGIRKLKKLYDYFYDINPVIDWDIYTPQQLIDTYAGKEFYREESYDYDHSEYLAAKEHILKNKIYYKI